jgi:hypothetical protein
MPRSAACCVNESLFDNSASMAIAATTAGINTMVANTTDQCAFA